MAKIKACSKRLDITKYFEGMTEDTEEIYITITRLSHMAKRKVQIMSMDTINGKVGTEIMKRMSKGENIKEDEFAKFMFDDSVTTEDRAKMINASTNIEKIIINEAVDSDNHNIQDETGKKYVVDYDFFDLIGNDELLKYIVDEIKLYSEKLGLVK